MGPSEVSPLLRFPVVIASLKIRGPRTTAALFDRIDSAFEKIKNVTAPGAHVRQS
jgi:hypothetical protein